MQYTQTKLQHNVNNSYRLATQISQNGGLRDLGLSGIPDVGLDGHNYKHDLPNYLWVTQMCIFVARHAYLFTTG